MRISTRSGISSTVDSRVFSALYAGITTATRFPLIMQKSGLYSEIQLYPEAGIENILWVENRTGVYFSISAFELSYIIGARTVSARGQLFAFNRSLGAITLVRARANCCVENCEAMTTIALRNEATRLLRSRYTFIVLQVLDLATTLVAFHMGAFEMNPLVARLASF